jgi:transcriptional regulator with XRE-family HTH domain
MDRIISNSEIGRKVKSYRQKAHLTQEKLAEILGVTVQQVQNYESGRTTLNVDNLQKICLALTTSPVDIFVDSSSDLYHLSQDEKSVIEKFRSIKDSDKINCVRTLLDALATTSK